MVKDTRSPWLELYPLGRNRPDAPLCHGVLHLGCGAYGDVSFQRRPLLGLMHRVHSFLCARYVPLQPAAEHYTAYRIQRHGCMRNLRDSTSNIAHLSALYVTSRYHFSHTIPVSRRNFQSRYSLTLDSQIDYSIWCRIVKILVNLLILLVGKFIVQAEHQVKFLRIAAETRQSSFNFISLPKILPTTFQCMS